MATVTTNNRERAYGRTITTYDERDFHQDGDASTTREMTAYGYTFTEDKVMPATDEMRAQGYDGYFPAAVTNAGSAVIVLRYFDRDGYELDGFVAGWWLD